MSRFLILLSFFLFFSRTTYALDASLFFFDDEELELINDPSKIDGEYYSDILAFGFSTENRLKFLQADNAYGISAGSLGSKRFSLSQQLKIKQQLSSKLSLSLRYLEVEDFEVARTHFFSGLTYSFNEFIELGAYTSLFSEKSDNDLGLSLKFNINAFNSLLFFVNSPDFSFNERIEGAYRNLTSTSNFGLKSSHNIKEKHKIEFYVLRNTPLKRLNEDDDLIYEFSETRFGILSSYERNSLSQRLLIDFFKGNEGSYLQTDPSDTWSREGLRINANLIYKSFNFGLDYNFRHWQFQNNKIIHRNLIPYIWYKINYKKYLSSIEFGIDTSIHRASGPISFRNQLDKDDDVNGRFNLRPSFKLSKNSFLNLLLSLDLDDGSWEGGGGQFQALF